MTKWFIKDDNPECLAPLCDLRATFEQRTGGLTTLERLSRQMGCAPAGFLCDDPLRAEMISERTGIVHVSGEEKTEVDHPNIDSPWALLHHLPELLSNDLENAEPLTSNHDVTTCGDHRIDIHPTAVIYPGVVLDASGGAIRIEEGVKIRSNAVVVGPCWIGTGSTICEHGLIKSNTSIGPSCKIGGEVGGTIFQGFANKCHDGHLGDSVIGEWVNIGAGTTNSNLLNTYGDVIVSDQEGTKHKTGRQFVGCFVGDYVKFAICTRIMTGTFIGTGAMIASSSPAPSPTPRFAWITDEGTRMYRLNKFLDVARTVMDRRGQALGRGTEAVLKKLAGE